MALIQAFYHVLERPTMLGVWAGMMLFLVPIWVAFAIGILVGWFWKPQWASKGTEKLSCSVSKASASSSYSSSSWTADYGKDKGQLSVSPAEYEDCRYLGIIGPLSLSRYYLATIWISEVVTCCSGYSDSYFTSNFLFDIRWH